MISRRRCLAGIAAFPLLGSLLGIARPALANFHVAAHWDLRRGLPRLCVYVDGAEQDAGAGVYRAMAQCRSARPPSILPGYSLRGIVRPKPGESAVEATLRTFKPWVDRA